MGKGESCESRESRLEKAGRRVSQSGLKVFRGIKFFNNSIVQALVVVVVVVVGGGIIVVVAIVVVVVPPC